MAKVKRLKGPGSLALKIVQKYFPEVTKVADARANINVEVTKRDDAIATRKAHKTCAMAIACKRAMKLDGVIISIKTAYLVKGKKAIRFQMPERASREVVSFDRGGGFATGTYQLDKPTPSAKLGARNERDGSHASGSRGYEGPKRHKVLTTGIRTVLGSEVE
jgi:hypothetical protein